MRDFFACSIFSESAPPVTMVKPVFAIRMMATGAAKYSSPPAMICNISTAPKAAPSTFNSLPTPANGSLMGLSSSGIVSASATNGLSIVSSRITKPKDVSSFFIILL